MSEYPSAKPTQDVTWATDGGAPKTEPSSGLRTAGYANKAIVAHDHLNFLLAALGESVDWLRSVVVRRFENLYEAYLATAWADPFVLRSNPGAVGAPGSLDTTKALPGAGSLNGSALCCDGARLYYGRSNVLYVAANTLSGDAEVLDSEAWTGTGNILCMHTDGHFIALGFEATAGTANSVLAWTVGADGTLTPFFDSGASTNDCTAVLCDYAAGGVTDGVIWFADSSTALYSVSAGEGAVAVTGTLGEVVMALDATTKYLFVALVSGILRAYPKATAIPTVGDPITNETPIEYVDLSYGSTRRASICNDGETVFYVIDGTGSGTGAAALQIYAYDIISATLLWSLSAPYEGSMAQRLRIHCDDRYVYCHWPVSSASDWRATIFRKADGEIVNTYTPSGNFWIAIDGGFSAWVLNSSAGNLKRLDMAREPGLWMRGQAMQGQRHRRLLLPAGSP